jgi:hypothetical protein
MLKIKEIVFGASTLLGAIFLFGSLFWSMLSENGAYFLVGYPLSAIFLLLAYIFRPEEYR